jgi:thiol:disulfide interchange protein DsbA
MKRLMWILVLLSALPAAAAPYVENRHYFELALPQPTETGNKVEVREFFWYGCPHCWELEPALEKWLKTLPKNALFVRTPGVGGVWRVHAQAYYAFEALGVLNKLHVPFFQALQEEQRKPTFDREQPLRNPLYNENSIADFVARRGVDRKAFVETFRSFGVRVKLDKALQMNAEAGISSVPTFLVDGRYLTSPSMAGGNAQMFKVIEFLVQKVARERKSGKKP